MAATLLRAEDIRRLMILTTLGMAHYHLLAVERHKLVALARLKLYDIVARLGSLKRARIQTAEIGQAPRREQTL